MRCTPFTQGRHADGGSAMQGGFRKAPKQGWGWPFPILLGLTMLGLGTGRPRPCLESTLAAAAARPLSMAKTSGPTYTPAMGAANPTWPAGHHGWIR